jgi:hypothetical protein
VPTRESNVSAGETTVRVLWSRACAPDLAEKVPVSSVCAAAGGVLLTLWSSTVAAALTVLWIWRRACAEADEFPVLFRRA